MDNLFKLPAPQSKRESTVNNSVSNINLDGLSTIESTATTRRMKKQELDTKSAKNAMNDLDWLMAGSETTKKPEAEPQITKHTMFPSESNVFINNNNPSPNPHELMFSKNILQGSGNLGPTTKSFDFNNHIKPQPSSDNTGATKEFDSSNSPKPTQIFTVPANTESAKFFKRADFCEKLILILKEKLSVKAVIISGHDTLQINPLVISINTMGMAIQATAVCDKLELFLTQSIKKVMLFKSEHWWANESKMSMMFQKLLNESKSMCLVEHINDVGIGILYFMCGDDTFDSLQTTEKQIISIVKEETISETIEMPLGIEQIDIDKVYSELQDHMRVGIFTETMSMMKTEDSFFLFGLKTTIGEFMKVAKDIASKYLPKEVSLDVPPYQIEYLWAIHESDLVELEKKNPGVVINRYLTSIGIKGFPKSKNSVRESIQRMLKGCIQEIIRINKNEYGISPANEQYFTDLARTCQCTAKIELETFDIPVKAPKTLNTQLNDIICPSALSIDIRAGDLAEQAVDMVVVCSTSENLRKNILEQAGTDIANQFKEAEKKNEITSKGYETSAGNLLCKTLFFLPWIKCQVQDTELKSSIKDFLDTAINHALKTKKTSIAFPAIGCGELGYDAGLIADTILQESKRFANHKLQIIIVVLKDKISDYETFCERLAKLRNKDLSNENLEVYKYDCKIIKLSATGSKDHIDLLRSKVENHVKTSVYSVDCDEFPFNAWNQSSINRFFQYCQDQRVLPRINEKDEHLILSGQEIQVNDVKTEFYRMKSVITEESRLASFARIACWVFQENSGITKKYTLKLNAIIEEANMHHQDTVLFKNEKNEHCTVDFKNMVEIYQERRRAIMRKDLHLPKVWQPQKSTVERFALHTDDPYYCQVKALFDTTMEGKYTDIKIERIQNQRWYGAYSIFKQHFQDPNSREFLFHGCPETSAEMIIHTCFNRSLAGVNGIAYGAGVYFSRRAIYSHSYTRPSPNTKNRTMFVVRVLVGKSIEGNNKMRKPPDGFDSTSGDKHIFVTYHDDQAYAHYLITYKAD